ncbi:MAG: hypothetical protein IIB56_02385 [Planctomycetes bacterium]|nr:hypothetical protein [Planctomycetota bacterium]MCH8119319.1 hypothetical protein [Planctomycetota bacterium]
MVKNIFIAILFFSIVIVCTLAGLFVASFTAAEPRQVDLTIYARRYAFDPPTIKLNKGDTVSINLITRDVTHGFYLEGYDIDAKVKPEDSPEYSTLLLRHPSKEDDYQEVERIEFVANKTGKFRYRCSQTCGYLHPFMQGELVVRPNYPFWAGVGFLIGIAIATLFSLMSRARQALPRSSSSAQAVTPDKGSQMTNGWTNES